jgi:hypothetical protein
MRRWLRTFLVLCRGAGGHDFTVMEVCRKPLMVGVGEILWDLLPAGRRLGGAPANFGFPYRASATTASDARFWTGCRL